MRECVEGLGRECVEGLGRECVEEDIRSSVGHLLRVMKYL